MNENEHLLTTLAEECSEVIQECAALQSSAARLAQSCSKANRFGSNNGYPDRDTTNAQDIAKELQELIAVAEMLEERLVIKPLPHTEKLAIRANKVKAVKHWMKHAENNGTLS